MFTFFPINIKLYLYMNIVFVLDHYNSKTDGTILTAERFEKELIRQGHSVKIVSFGVLGENKYGLKENSLPIVSAIAKKSNVHFAKFNKKIIAKAFEGADVVHLFMPFSLERRALRLARRMGIAVSAAFHVHPDNVLRNVGIKRLSVLTRFIFWLWRKNFYDKVNYIHCPSEFTAKELIKHKYRAKLYVISNGVAPYFVPKSKPGYARDRRFEILMVGRLSAEKRQDLLIKAVETSKYKDIINITFAGSGPYKEKYQNMARKLVNEPTFAFMDQESLLKKIYASDLYIHAADVEIEGISCIEAFSCGLVPVIGRAEKSAAKQFIIDDRCGFESDNYEMLRERIEYFIENPDELSELSLAYCQFSQKYRLEDSVKAIVSMFEEAIQYYKEYKL